MTDRKDKAAAAEAGDRALTKTNYYSRAAALAEYLQEPLPDEWRDAARLMHSAKEHQTLQHQVVEAMMAPKAQRERRRDLQPLYVEAQRNSAKAKTLEDAIAQSPLETPEQAVQQEIAIAQDALGRLAAIFNTHRDQLEAMVANDVDFYRTLGQAYMRTFAWKPGKDTLLSEAAAQKGKQDSVANAARPYVELMLGSSAAHLTRGEIKAVVAQGLEQLAQGIWPNAEKIMDHVEARTRRHHVEELVRSKEVALAALKKEAKETPYSLAAVQRTNWEATRLPQIQDEVKTLVADIDKLQRQLAATA